MNNATIQPECFVFLTSGEYEDYSIIGLYKSVSEINIIKLREEWAINNPNKRILDKKSLIEYMINSGLLQPLDSHEIYLGRKIDEIYM
jgi:hypothetical protein